MRLLNPNFPYVSSANTNVADTFRRFGFKPTSEAERKAAQQRLHATKRPSLRAVKSK